MDSKPSPPLGPIVVDGGPDRAGRGTPEYRTPPHNEEAEQALLGAILVNNKAYERVSEFLRPQHFYDPVHQRIYEAISKLIERGQVANPVTLKAYFENDPGLVAEGGGAYLAELAASVVTVVNAGDYGKTIHDLFLRRQLIEVGTDMVNEAYQHDLDSNAMDQIEQAEKQLFDLASTGDVQGGFIAFSESLKVAIEMAETAFRRSSHVTGVTSGLRDLDRKLGGMHPSDLIILAGRPSMGKAQPLDARILTAEGWKAMGEIRAGERLASVDGAPSMVSGIFPQGTKQIFRVTFSDGRSTECCDEHLWRVHYRDWEAPRVLPTAKIREMLERVRYRGRLWIDVPSGDFGHDEALPVPPWALGALLGDGTLSGGSARFSTAEPEMLERLAAAIGDDYALVAAGGYDHRIVQAGGHHRPGVQGVNPNALKQALIGLGLWDVRSEAKFIPPVYLGANRAARLDLLRGLLDTDGWVERWGSVRFCTTSERLASDVTQLVRSLGGTCTVATKDTAFSHKGEQRQGRTAYVCNIQHADPASLMLLSHKRGRVAAGRTRQKRLTLRSVEPTRMAEAQCIAVTHPSRLYITDDYVVTHNTALATNIAFNAAKAHMRSNGGEGACVGFFSLEMSAEQLATRILAGEAEVSGDKIRRGDIRDSDFPKFIQASQELGRVPFFVDDTPALSVAAVRTRCRRLKRTHGLGMVVVDYLQLLRGTSPRGNENRVQEISEITRGLKAIAKELDLPVLALSQLSRAVEMREDKRPQLADLRESGSIEQDADVVMFVYREQYYLERAEPARRPEETEDKYNDRYANWQKRYAEVHNTAEAIIAKQRHGPIGSVRLYFDGQYTRFGDLDTTHDHDVGE